MKKLFQFIILLIILLISFRTDFRFKTNVECCSDDYTYYAHAETIAIDWDLDYSNQITQEHPFYYSKNDKLTPIGFIGSGIISSPFMFIGNFMNNLFEKNLGFEKIYNYKILLYSFSSVFYFFITYILITKIFSKLQIHVNKYLVLLVFSGSGITYYAFERFSMTHIYEVFTITLLIYVSINSYNSYSKYHNLSSFFVPIVLTLSFLTRMNNLFIFIVPIIVKKLIKNYSQNKIFLLKNIYFYLGSFISIFLYSKINIALYGEVIFNPQRIYGTNIAISGLVGSEKNILALTYKIIFTISKVMFSFEFGLFWVSAVIFLGFLVTMLNLKDFTSFSPYIYLFIYLQNLAIIYIWQGTASSYGYRYLLCLLPISMLQVFRFFEIKILKYYLLAFSLIGVISVIFFETTTLTQLSTSLEFNTFGDIRRYTQPQYLKGLFLSFFSFNSYLIIFSTSFLGAIFFKTLLITIGESKMFYVFNNLGLPINNEDFIDLISKLNIINLDKFFTTIIILMFFCYIVVYKIPEKT